MFEVMYMLMAAGGLCFLFGVVYPVAAILAYPIYRKFGGNQSLREYIRLL